MKAIYYTVLVISILCLLPGMELVEGASPDGWLMWGQNPQHTGLSPYPIANNPLGIMWEMREEGVYFSSPPSVTADGLIVVAANDADSVNAGKLFALNLTNGDRKWSLPLVQSVGPVTPAIDANGTIYVTTHPWPFLNNSHLLAVNSNGTLRWSASISETSLSSPTLSPDGSVYITAPSGKLYSYLPNGTEHWNLTLPGVPNAMCPSIGNNGTVYVSCNNYAAIAISPDGSVLWAFQTGFGSNQLHETSTPVIAPNGTIYAASADRNIYALWPNGTLKWTFNTGVDYLTWINGVTLLPNGNLVCLPGGMNAFENLTCLTANGQLWEVQIPEFHGLNAQSQ